MRMIRPVFLLIGAAALAGCSFVPTIPGVTPYRIEIQQGNFISQEQVVQLKPGMSKEQVRLALGTPMLADLFHADRWDYVYWREAVDGRRESRKLAVFFADGKLERVAGDGVPDQAPPAKETK
jgi:outer membrane protein assembly factor BamE